MKTNFKQGTLTPHMKYLYQKAIAAFQVKTDKYILKDGSTILISDFKVNGLALIQDGENLIPLGAGDYELKDGRKFTVVDGGIITAIAKGKFYTVVKFTPASKKFAATKEDRIRNLAKQLSKLKN